MTLTTVVTQVLAQYVAAYGPVSRRQMADELLLQTDENQALYALLKASRYTDRYCERYDVLANDGTPTYWHRSG